MNACTLVNTEYSEAFKHILKNTRLVAFHISVASKTTQPRQKCMHRRLQLSSSFGSHCQQSLSVEKQKQKCEHTYNRRDVINCRCIGGHLPLRAPSTYPSAAIRRRDPSDQLLDDELRQPGDDVKKSGRASEHSAPRSPLHPRLGESDAEEKQSGDASPRNGTANHSSRDFAKRLVAVVVDVVEVLD